MLFRSTAEQPLIQGTWNHVAITYGGPNTLKIYINGEESVLGLNNATIDGSVILPNSDILMGGDYDLGNSALDEFRIWDVVRTQAEIQANMGGALTTPYSDSLVRYYDFNHGISNGENSGSTSLEDRTGNGVTGTLAGFDLTADSVSNWKAASSLGIQAPADVVVNALNLDALVSAPVKDGAQNTTAIDETQYTGAIEWFESNGITSVAGN